MHSAMIKRPPAPGARVPHPFTLRANGGRLTNWPAFARGAALPIWPAEASVTPGARHARSRAA